MGSHARLNGPFRRGIANGLTGHFCFYLKYPTFAAPAGVAKLADVPDLGSGAVRHAGSTPVARTKRSTGKQRRIQFLLTLVLFCLPNLFGVVVLDAMSGPSGQFKSLIFYSPYLFGSLLFSV